MNEELKNGDLAMVQGVDNPEGEPRLAEFYDDHCGPRSDCDPTCCRMWFFFGTDMHARPDAVEVVRRVKVVDCE